MKTKIKWIDGVSFVGESGSGHSVVIDGAPEHGGRNIGIRPMELFLMGAVACTAFDVVHILKKARQPIVDCHVDADAERAPADPKVFTKIHLRYTVAVHGLARPQVERAVKLLPGIADLAGDLQTLFGGATLRASWWGTEAVLSGAAAVAFSKLLNHDLNAVLSALAPFFPNAAVLLVFTVPAGAVAKVWIDQVQGFDRSRAVKLEPLFWVVPWVWPAEKN